MIKQTLVGEPFIGADGGTYQRCLFDAGDQSHKLPCDRLPPEALVPIAHGLPGHLDRRDCRTPLICPYPGKDIADLEGRHSGTVAVLFNGPSLASKDLRAITCPTIGMNRTIQGYSTYDGPNPDYYVCADLSWTRRPEVVAHPGLVNASVDPKPHGYRVARSYRMKPFSFDLARDGVVNCTSGHIALQVAVYLGFDDIYCLGLDLAGPHWDGSESAATDHQKGGNLKTQRVLMKEALPLLADRGIQVSLCGSPGSSVDFLPHTPFWMVCE